MPWRRLFRRDSRSCVVVITKESALRVIAVSWTVFAAALALAAVVGLFRISPLFSDMTQNWPTLLTSDVVASIAITAKLFFLSMLLQVVIALLVVSCIDTLGIAFSMLLVVPFAVGAAAPATIARAVLSPQLSHTLLASLDPLSSSLGVSAVVVLFDTWQWVGLLILAMCLRLKHHQTFLRDAAAIEGFGRLRTISWLIFPACKPVIMVYALLKALDWLRKEDLLTALVGDLGGPQHINRTTALLLSRWYYGQSEQTPLAAACIFVQVVVLAVGVRWILNTRAAKGALGLSNDGN